MSQKIQLNCVSARSCWPKLQGKKDLSDVMNCQQLVIISSILEFKRKMLMQARVDYQNHQTSFKLLQKCTSQPSIPHSRPSPLPAPQTHLYLHRKQAILWLFSFRKVPRDTQYLALALLNRLPPQRLTLNQHNHELVALCLLLVACKMNEVYPPKISQLLAKCRRPFTQEQVVSTEAEVLAALDFEVALDSTVYSHLQEILGSFYGSRLEECQKLYRMVCCWGQVADQKDQIAAHAIVYLILPDLVRRMKLAESPRIKALAIKIYNLYHQEKKEAERQKQNRNAPW